MSNPISPALRHQLQGFIYEYQHAVELSELNAKSILKCVRKAAKDGGQLVVKFETGMTARPPHGISEREIEEYHQRHDKIEVVRQEVVRTVVTLGLLPEATGNPFAAIEEASQDNKFWLPLNKFNSFELCGEPSRRGLELIPGQNYGGPLRLPFIPGINLDFDFGPKLD